MSAENHFPASNERLHSIAKWYEKFKFHQVLEVKIDKFNIHFCSAQYAREHNQLNKKIVIERVQEYINLSFTIYISSQVYLNWNEKSFNISVKRLFKSENHACLKKALLSHLNSNWKTVHNLFHYLKIPCQDSLLSFFMLIQGLWNC